MLNKYSKKVSHLPEPSASEKVQSQAVSRQIANRIQNSGGAIPFSEFMELALFSGEGGYYTSSRTKLGKAGDFVTAPELSNLFSQCLSEQSAQVLAQLSQGHMLELGAGTGRMAGQILQTLVTEKDFVGQYYILEPSGALRAEQAAYLGSAFPELFSRFVWLDTLPAQFTGVILANEVVDAFPVERFMIESDRIHRAWVAASETQANGFVEIYQTSDLPSLEALRAAHDWPLKYQSEYHPQLSAWLAALSHSLAKGALLILDYGFPEASYYHPDRQEGTLMCHYRHHAHADPFFYPGLQDITAHVNFSALAKAAVETGWQGLGYSDQAHFLIDLGLLKRLEAYLSGIVDTTAPEALKAIQGVQILLSPSEMGELIKVIALGKNLSKDTHLSGFVTKNRYSQLVNF